MSDLEPRRSSGVPSRKARERRAYNLVLATGGLAVLTIVLVVLAIVGVVGFGSAVLAGLLTAGGAVLVRRTLNP
jgi:hypothetical protein